MPKLTKLQIEKPFTSHEATLREMYVLDGFITLMESLIEATRREITDNKIIDIEFLRFRQGELTSYQKILKRAEISFKKTKKINTPLEEQVIPEVKI